MGLYRRGKIFWFSIMHEGKRVQSSTKTDNKKLVELIYAKALTNLIEDRYFDKQKAKTVTSCIMVDRYIQKHQKERDRYSLKHLSPFFGNITLAEIESEMADDYIIFVIHTGCRAGEIISINRNGIDMKRRIVTINSSKGGIKNKVIPMSNILYGMLQRRLRISHISGKIFPVTRDVLKDAFRKVMKRAGIEKLHFHDFQHTFATRLIQGG